MNKAAVTAFGLPLVRLASVSLERRSLSNSPGDVLSSSFNVCKALMTSFEFWLVLASSALFNALDNTPDKLVAILALFVAGDARPLDREALDLLAVLDSVLEDLHACGWADEPHLR